MGSRCTSFYVHSFTMPSLSFDQLLHVFESLLLALITVSLLHVGKNPPSSGLHGLEPHPRAARLSWFVLRTATPDDTFADCVKCNIIESLPEQVLLLMSLSASYLFPSAPSSSFSWLNTSSYRCLLSLKHRFLIMHRQQGSMKLFALKDWHRTQPRLDIE